MDSSLNMADSRQPSFETTKIQGPNGVLAVDIHKPDITPGDRVPLVILMHGFKANRRGPLLDAIFNAMSQAGLGVLRFDFDGCGESAGKFVDMTVPKEIEDALSVYSYASKLPWIDRVYFVGHSQGGGSGIHDCRKAWHR